MKRGRLIILNGGLSSGKTSLGLALQDVMEEMYLLLGIDAFWLALPPKELDLERVDPNCYTWDVENEDGREYFRIHPGPILDRVMFARYRAIAVFLDLGVNVIADDVIWKPEWLEDAVAIFSPYEVVFVGVFVSDEEGTRREALRNNRHVGWHRGSARCAHRHGVYDLIIDTTHESPESCAGRIKLALDEGLVPSAFATLRKTSISKAEGVSSPAEPTTS